MLRGRREYAVNEPRSTVPCATTIILPPGDNYFSPSRGGSPPRYRSCAQTLEVMPVVTDAQVRKLMEEVDKGVGVGIAALRTGMDRKTARRYVAAGQLPSELPHQRSSCSLLSPRLGRKGLGLASTLRRFS